MSGSVQRVLLHIDDGLRHLVDPAQVFYLEADGDSTRVHFARGQPLTDVRPMSEIQPRFAPHDFLRIHRSYMVNLLRIQLLRRRRRGRDWEIQLEPPVSRVLPVSRDSYPKLLTALEGPHRRGRG